MTNLLKHVPNFILLLALIVVFGCNAQKKIKTDKSVQTIKSTLNPFSDQENKEGWVLNDEISDEFEGTSIDTTKWFVEGQNGDYYIWKGRAPSQFVPHNVRVEDGKLKLRTAWEPDYPFFQETYTDGNMGTAKYGEYEGKPIPVTTAGVISKKRFLNGYMEVKSKVGNAAITGAFWAIGYEQELDVYELMGNPKKPGNIKANSYLATAHDWSPPAKRPTNVFQHTEDLPYRTADEFHVYGAEWGEDFLKLFIDDKLVHHFTQNDVGLDWVLNNPMEVWLDSEIFFWLGLPHKEELPVDFEIEYMRVWQKPSDNLLAKDRAFYGFEGPILFEDVPRPLTMVPEDSNANAYQKFWLIDEGSSKYFSIVEGQYASGVESLQFAGYGKGENFEVEKASVLTPEGAINIGTGDYTFSMKVWLDQGRISEKIYVSFENPKLEIVFKDLSKLARRQWVTLEANISKTAASAKNDQLKIEIRKEDLPKDKAPKIFIDDIAIKKAKK
ncbi:glycosyl hydrolase family 16 [Mariniflexile fucanivorans]|uniref:Glycosyl hydrolase family 16 n=1 Tax=Mariniflexile fucanivorans TaxID=264023 RepID=A0A4R1RKY1_9FLAO|nr:family 16 glycosylhydrolase [Mariniflexile fucanivorans]TCL66868.1 glycosyl hydrolase family 16 [Mariniflexile fucanivorans]